MYRKFYQEDYLWERVEIQALFYPNFFRGLYGEIAKIDNGSASVQEFIQALVGGYQMAYRAVMDPVEGTILTVVRESAEKVLREQSNLNSVEEVLKTYLEQAKETLLKNT